MAWLTLPCSIFVGEQRQPELSSWPGRFPMRPPLTPARPAVYVNDVVALACLVVYHETALVLPVLHCCSLFSNIKLVKEMKLEYSIYPN